MRKRRLSLVAAVVVVTIMLVPATAQAANRASSCFTYGLDHPHGGFNPDGSVVVTVVAGASQVQFHHGDRIKLQLSVVTRQAAHWVSTRTLAHTLVHRSYPPDYQTWTLHEDGLMFPAMPNASPLAVLIHASGVCNGQAFKEHSVVSPLRRGMFAAT